MCLPYLMDSVAQDRIHHFHPSTQMGKSVKKTKTKAILEALSDSALNASPVRASSGAAKGRDPARGTVLCHRANRSLEE
jgi:hypothetical protein